MPILETIFTVANLTNFLGKIYDGWRFLQENRERNLNREQERYILDARNRHELVLLEARRNIEPTITLISVPSENAVEIDSDNFLLLRLQKEAQKLAEMGFDIIYECVRDGYGLALPVDDDLVFGFLIPPDYPTEAPTILVKQGTTLEEIPFEDGAWSSTFMFVDILTQLVPAYQNANTAIVEVEGEEAMKNDLGVQAAPPIQAI